MSLVYGVCIGVTRWARKFNASFHFSLQTLALRVTVTCGPHKHGSSFKMHMQCHEHESVGHVCCGASISVCHENYALPICYANGVLFGVTQGRLPGVLD
eukprot:1160894-Pelagomonas_calceolata.AAC.22